MILQIRLERLHAEGERGLGAVVPEPLVVLHLLGVLGCQSQFPLLLLLLQVKRKTRRSLL